MRSVAPTGSAPAPNNWSRVTDPSTTTFAALATSCSVKNAPNCTGHERIAGSSSLVPCTCVFQFEVSPTICVRVLMVGEM